ncbi:FG-GAP repeat domain-containing protein [Actinacidiphila sp. bgisy145]|uniref:FG-GAP repeat domain-containing protein n=1 Tax=Actinacidiphila sp. bgisy145 TaxID=3413792 RepID=UPI003EB99941
MRKRFAAVAAATVCTALAASTGCSGGGGGRAAHHAGPYDLDGDGRAALVVTNAAATVDGLRDGGYAVVLPGGPQGPDTKRAGVLTQNGIGAGPAGQGAYFGAHVASADLDGDGRADLVVQAGYSTLFVVWGGTVHSGGAKDAGKNAHPGRLHGVRPFTGDFDGDGHPDIASVGSRPDSETISYGPFSRSGAPARTATVQLPVDTGDPDSDFLDEDVVAVGDVNGDGRDDLITSWDVQYTDIADTPRATVVWYGTPTGFRPGPRLKDAQGRDVYGSSYDAPYTVGDFDGDGCADIAVGLPDELGPEQEEPGPPEGGTRLTVWYGGRHGSSHPPLTLTAATPGLPGTPAATAFGAFPAAGDVDGDGRADLAFLAEEQGGTAAELLVLRGGPDGLTTAAAQRVTGHDISATAMLDTDGDGRADLAIGGAGVQYPGVTVLRGTAAGLDLAHPVTVRADALGTAIPPGGNGFGSAFGK